MIYISHYQSPLGEMTMASDGEALIGLWFDGQKYDRNLIQGESSVETILPVFLETKQAVGGAVGHNPIALIVPCHRVLGSNGSLTGYAGGLWIKEWLLKKEGILFRKIL